MYGMYFLEVADYYTRENNDEKEMLMLVYQSLRALILPAIQNELILYIFEIKALVVNGEFPGIPANKSLSSDTLYTIDYVVKSGLDRLYTFVVSDEGNLQSAWLNIGNGIWDMNFTVWRF